MSEVEDLLKAYENLVRLPWDSSLAGPEKVWFVVYDPAQERRIRLRLPEFETVTKKHGHGWRSVDLTDSFARWISTHKYRDSYFEEPELLEPALQAFTNAVAQEIKAVLTAEDVDLNTVVCLTGVASLYGLTKVSNVLEKVTADLRGRLLVCFPGEHDGQVYKILGAREGWNYLAVPITTKKWGVE